ncbi:MAG: type II secretion system protein GspK [Candidatus Omnitrophica bacterium]|nr:type II secretion system protein GspK [Candidatus Omnitrophota bacterium]
MKNTKGSLLILVLWVFLFLSIMSVFAGSLVHQQIKVFKETEIDRELINISESGMAFVRNFVLNLNLAGQKVYALNETWADSDKFKGYETGNGKFYLYHEQFDNNLKISSKKNGLIDENRKVNINYASFDVLRRLFVEIGGASQDIGEELARIVIDFRDSDSNVFGLQEETEEYAYYLRSNVKYIPDKKFFSIKEIYYLPYITAAIYENIKDFITVYGSGKVNINTASLSVLKVLGLADSAAEKVSFFRSGADMKEGTADDNVVFGLNNLIDKINAVIALDPDEQKSLHTLVISNRLCVNSEYFMATGISILENETRHGKITCILDNFGVIKDKTIVFVNKENHAL